MFDWNDLKYFLAVAQHGSTLSAAKSLRVNQSTVHRRIEELERQLGCALVIAILQDIGLPRWASTFARVHHG